MICSEVFNMLSFWGRCYNSKWRCLDYLGLTGEAVMVMRVSVVALRGELLKERETCLLCRLDGKIK